MKSLRFFLLFTRSPCSPSHVWAVRDAVEQYIAARIVTVEVWARTSFASLPDIPLLMLSTSEMRTVSYPPPPDNAADRHHRLRPRRRPRRSLLPLYSRSG